MKYLGILLFIILFVSACSFENTRQSIGINTNPFSTKFEEKTKVGYSITFGKERKETIKEE